MYNGKRLVAALLCAAALLTAVPAAAATALPAVNAYPGFADVGETDWFHPYAKLCYEVGLMKGTGSGFSPSGTLTVGEAATIAARIREGLTGEAIPGVTPVPGETLPWYQAYVSYLTHHGVTVPDPQKAATRAEFFRLLSAVTDPELLPAINAIQTLPDTAEPDVLRFYNAGVLTGTDAYGTFNANGTLSRAECAAMAARIVDPALRRSFTPQVKADPPALSYEEELMQTEAVRINGVSVNFRQYLDVLNACVAETDAALLSNSGKGLDWNATYSDVDDLPAYFKNMALSRVAEQVLLAAQARALGCDPEDLPAVLVPDPSQVLDRVYCAKHILVSDEQTATALIALLRASPSLETFDALLAEYGTDPGMKSNPQGYLFTDGDMVAEFETAVKGLALGACSNAPVKSSFGYHIILRLDPTTRAGWQQEVREMLYEAYVDAWMNSATVTTNDAELTRLDVPARYAAYLAAQGG